VAFFKGLGATFWPPPPAPQTFTKNLFSLEGKASPVPPYQCRRKHRGQQNGPQEARLFGSPPASLVGMVLAF